MNVQEHTNRKDITWAEVNEIGDNNKLKLEQQLFCLHPSKRSDDTRYGVMNKSVIVK